VILLQPLGDLVERLSLGVAEKLPASAQLLADLGVVHVGCDFDDLAPFVL